MVTDLTRNRNEAERLSGAQMFHIGPDIEPSLIERKAGWRAALGQVGAAQGHLSNRGVEVGDVFLFFGWFRQATRRDGFWQYVPRTPNLHALFGWLQIGDIFKVNERRGELNNMPWLHDHPHVVHADHYAPIQNTIYIASERLRLKGLANKFPGAGAFARWSSGLQLTAPGCGRSQWQLPSWMHPDAPSGSTLSYHPNNSFGQFKEPAVRLRSAAIGQEFVLNTGHQEELQGWLQKLIEEHA